MIVFLAKLLYKYNYNLNNLNKTLHQYCIEMLREKWLLFDINNEEIFIILKINEYDLYEKYVSKNKLNTILESNTSIVMLN